MKKLLDKILSSVETFNRDALLQIEKNDKLAATRARRRALEIEAFMQEFQLLSLKLKDTSITINEQTSDLK